ncbi:unnamed protein product [Gongylonema pulchrum]|uniref:Secreted protein n=1 Tax=Gongylonema pulchrum TaxID=637853 RepID=A0A183CXG0_9BILA|nr:unnamed protein product [Gongylonema pulchrum]
MRWPRLQLTLAHLIKLLTIRGVSPIMCSGANAGGLSSLFYGLGLGAPGQMYVSVCYLLFHHIHVWKRFWMGAHEQTTHKASRMNTLRMLEGPFF